MWGLHGDVYDTTFNINDTLVFDEEMLVFDVVFDAMCEMFGSPYICMSQNPYLACELFMNLNETGPFCPLPP